MAFKYCMLFALVAAASAAVLPVAVKHIEYADTPAEYQFEYSVHDDHTGDIKSQREERHASMRMYIMITRFGRVHFLDVYMWGGLLNFNKMLCVYMIDRFDVMICRR
uniref:Uncharacterized protein n=1 Tax=Anopheles culicifacies TaxID=139723 RepID=A0A182MIZ6_9DIPT